METKKPTGDHLQKLKKYWCPFSIVYDPLKAGSIDGTDTEPHDKAIIRAQTANYRPSYKAKGKPECTIFVSRLDYKTKESDVKLHFSKYGRIISCRVVEDIVTGRTKGYAFIEFETERAAGRAYRNAHRTVLDGREIFVDMECERLLPGWIPRRLDVIRTDPSQFGIELNTSISQFLNEKFANKVVPNVGLCVALFDLLSVDDSYIFPGDGAAHTKVEFRFVVFRPFVEEIIVGKIKNCSKEGVHITLGFFDDIFVPSANLQHPSRFDEAEQVWIWEYDNNGDKHDLFMDQGEPVKFRVTAETFIESSPAPCPDNEKAVEKPNFEIPYSITATINEPGLGLLTWWEGS